MIAGPTVTVLALLGDGEVVGSRSGEGHLVELDGLLVAVGKDVGDDGGATGSDGCPVGVIVRLCQREGESGRGIVAHDLLGHAQGSVTRKGDGVGHIGVREGGRAARLGRHGTVAVIGDNNRHGLAGGGFGVVCHAVNAARLCHTIDVGAWLGIGNLAKARGSALAVRVFDRGVHGHGGTLRHGLNREGVLACDIARTGEPLRHGEDLGSLDQVGGHYVLDAIGVGEGEVVALDG